jgi:predicted Zn-dependent protease
MKFTPKEFTEEVNFPKEAPLKELGILLGGILGIIVLIYILIGFAVDIIVTRYPVKIEQTLVNLYSQRYKSVERTETELKLQEVLDKLVKQPAVSDQKYSVYIHNKDIINAMALPGGNIVIFSGLLKEVESENELAFVLAHELGHYAHNDHLRSLGRGLVFVVISTVLFGNDSSVTSFILNSVQNVESRFSQQQEMAADLWAVNLLNKRYGHVSGSLEFLEKMSKREKLNKFFYFFATHPHPEDRVYVCKKAIKQNGYLQKEVIPMKLAVEYPKCKLKT